MKDRILALPWRFIVVLIFLLPALLLLFDGSGLPCTHDNALHYYRITAMRAAWRQGWTFSRWVPNLALGYGYPFFNFREPLPYLVGTALYSFGIPLPLVLGSIYAGSLIAAAWGAYELARALFGKRAAWIAALAYGLGPYLLLDTFRRGNMPESVALALLPWLLLTFRRVLLGEGRRPFVASVLLLAALFLSHNITSLLFAPFLGGYVVVLAYLHRKRRAWGWAFVAVALAVVLTAWFWFPALTEQHTVQLHLSRTTRNNDFHYNFATWKEMLFTLPVPYDADFLNPPMRVPLGVVQVALAVIGTVVGLWCAREREQRVLIVFFAATAVAYLWMSTPSSVRLWEAFPLLAFVQFPWRLVGRALLPAVLLAGAAFPAVASGAKRQESRIKNQESGITFYVSRITHHASRILSWITLVALVIFSWPDTYPPKGFCAMSPHPGLADVYAFEREGWMGVDPEGSYFPVWVEEQPVDTRLADAYARGDEPERFDNASLPEGAQILDALYRPLRAALTVETPESFRARWLGFYFPGWRVTIDGVPVTVEPEADTGMLIFDVPEGRHEIVVRFGTTPVRLAVSIVSGIGVMLLGLAIWRIKLQSKRDSHPISDARHFWQIGVLALGLLALKLLLVDHAPNPLRRSRLETGDLPEVLTALQQPFSDGLTLLGYELATDELPADAEVQIDLLWGTRAVPSVEYRTAVLLKGSDGQLWSYAGTARPRGYEPTPPTTMWQPGQYAYDPHIVQPLPGAPPGEYSVVVGLFDRRTLAPASILGADGNPAGPDLTLGTLRVTRAQSPPDLRALDVPEDATLQVCGPVGLWSMAADRDQAAPGEIVGLRWVWEAVEMPDSAIPAMLTLRDATGDSVWTWELPPVAAWWPTDRWSEGDRWVGRPVIRLPGDLDGGEYRLVVGMPVCEAALAEASIAISAPDRVWEVPDDVIPADVAFDGKVRLAGYAIEPASLVPGAQVRVRLVWQALDAMSASYRVFLHLQDAEGRIVGQDDGEPVDWMRPTTGWAVGEVVSEVREIALPPDARPSEYVLRVGVYLPEGARLLTADGADAFVLDTVRIP